MRCLKTPFAHQGRVPGLGMDCAGLFIQVCRELSLEHKDASGYPRNPYDGKLEAELDAQLDREEKDWQDRLSRYAAARSQASHPAQLQQLLNQAEHGAISRFAIETLGEVS